jgi:hypothetical protein
VFRCCLGIPEDVSFHELGSSDRALECKSCFASICLQMESTFDLGIVQGCPRLQLDMDARQLLSEGVIEDIRGRGLKTQVVS